jgi:hypothetical protein
MAADDHCGEDTHVRASEGADASGGAGRFDRCSVREMLPLLVSGVLASEERACAERHIAECAECATELAEWHAVADATNAAWQADEEPAPVESWHRLEALIAGERSPAAHVGPHISAAGIRSPVVIGTSELASAAGSVREGRAAVRPARGGIVWVLRRAWLLLAAQIPVVRRQIWAASAMVVVVSAALVLLADVEGSDVFALLAPLVAAGGIALVYGPEVDPACEVLASTPTSPRAILIARLVLVLAYDTCAFLVGSLLLVALEAGLAFVTLVLAWLGPMLLLSALCLVVTLWLRPAAGIGLALALWAVRVVSESPAHSLLRADVASFVRDAWSSRWLVIVLAAALFGCAVLCVPRARRVA